MGSGGAPAPYRSLTDGGHPCPAPEVTRTGLVHGKGPGQRLWQQAAREADPELAVPYRRCCPHPHPCPGTQADVPRGLRRVLAATAADLAAWWIWSQPQPERKGLPLRKPQGPRCGLSPRGSGASAVGGPTAGSPWGESRPRARLLPPPPSGLPRHFHRDPPQGWGIGSPSSAWTDGQVWLETMLLVRPDLSCVPFRPLPPPGLPALPFTVDRGTRSPGCGVDSCVHGGWAPHGRLDSWVTACGTPTGGPAPPSSTLSPVS